MMRLKRDIDDKGITAPLQTGVIVVVVVPLVIFGGMWVAVGGNPLGTHTFVDAKVDIGATGLEGVTIDDSTHSTTKRKGYETFKMSDFSWWDPTSKDITVRGRLLVNGEIVDTDTETEDVGLDDFYMETFHLTFGPLPDDATSYTVEVEAIVDGSIEDTTTLEGSA